MEPGSRVGPYEIVALVGAGGMGEVYRARDPRLARDVALKVLHPHRAADRERVLRFEQEAKAAGALNHPNLLTVFDTGQHESSPYIVFELLQGQTLRERLERGPLPPTKAVEYAIQLAVGLAAAHEHGLVHRDLKPENVFVTRDGRVKILDFGLAKLLQEDGWDDGAVDTPTRTLTAMGVTQEGVAMGTPGYMSPEQAQGQPVDSRSDVFSFGAVLFEMLSGRRAFPSHGSPFAVVTDDPAPLEAGRAPLPPGLERVIHRCLEKRPQDRFQSARDISFALEALARQSPTPSRVDPLAAPPRARSIAVLPLVNVSGDREQDYFVDGMTDALISDLARVRALRVISRTSAMRYQNTRKPLRQIARELKVDAVVEGSVLRVGGQVRITAQLVDAARDEHLWAGRYERDLQDVLRLQAEVASAITAEVRIAVTPQEQVALASAPLVDPEAHRQYLLGRFQWNKRTPDALGRALHHFTLALEQDPACAPAYAGIADSLFIQTASTYDLLPPRWSMPRAKEAALKALEIDESLAEAHVSLGNVLARYDWDWPAADREYRRALELNPGDAYAYHCYAAQAAALGALDEALLHQEAARVRDPFSLVVRSGLSRHLYFARDYERSIAESLGTLEMEPRFWVSHVLLGMCRLQQGEVAQAIEDFRAARAAAGGSSLPIAALAAAYGVAGESPARRDALQELMDLGRARYVPAYQVAIVAVGAGDVEEAFAWLERAYVERAEVLSWLDVEPFWDTIRDDPRFRHLTSRIAPD